MNNCNSIDMKKIILFTLLLICSYIMRSYSQENVNRNLEISGIVLDAANQPLPGVSIYIKNVPAVGTTTDTKGKFNLKVGYRETVVFQMIGMTSVEYFVEKSNKEVEIILEDDSQQLEEVVR